MSARTMTKTLILEQIIQVAKTGDKLWIKGGKMLSSEQAVQPY